MTTIHLSPESFAIVSAAAAKRGVHVDEFVRTEILSAALLALVAGPVEQGETLVEDAIHARIKATEHEPAPVPPKKKRKKQRPNWVCPCCGVKYKASGNKLHFLSCCTKAGMTVREIAQFCQGDLALARMYGRTESSSVDDVEEGIWNIAYAVHIDHRLRTKASAESSSAERQRLTAKARLAEGK